MKRCERFGFVVLTLSLATAIACVANGCRRKPAPQPPPQPAAFDVVTSPDGNVIYRIDGQVVDRGQIRAALAARRDAQGVREFVLRVDDDITYGDTQIVLIDLAMSVYESGRLESRDGIGYVLNMPRKVKDDLAGLPAPMDVVIGGSPAAPMVTVGEETSTDFGAALIRLLAKARAAAPADTPAAVFPDRELRYRDVLRVYGACQEAGFEHVVFRTSR